MSVISDNVSQEWVRRVNRDLALLKRHRHTERAVPLPEVAAEATTNVDEFALTAEDTGVYLAPVVPSTPMTTTTMASVTVAWDGYGAGGEAMPANFSHVTIHRSPTGPDFEPEEFTQAAVLRAEGAVTFADQPYGETTYYRFVMHTIGGETSAPSETAIGVAVKIETEDISVGAVEAENIRLGVFNKNLVPDPTFEEEYVIEPDGPDNKHRWRIIASGVGTGGSVTAVRRIGGARSGAQALNLSVSATGAPDNHVQVYSGVSEVEPGKQYALSFHATKTDATTARLYARIAGGSDENLTEYPADTTGNCILFEGEDPNFAENQDVVAGGVTTPELYTPFGGLFTVPAGINFVAVRFFNWKPSGASEIVIDDVAIVEFGKGATELTSAGLRLFDVNGSEVAAFVSNRPNYFSINKDGDTVAMISSDGHGSFAGLSVDADPEVEGHPLIGKYGATIYDNTALLDGVNRDWEAEPLGLLEQYSKGVVAWFQCLPSDITNTLTNGQEMGLFELGFDLEPGRIYAFRTGSILVTAGGAGVVGLRLRATYDGTIPSLSSNAAGFSYAYAGAAGQNVSVGFPERLVVGSATNQSYARYLLCLYSSVSGTTELYHTQSIEGVIEDLGPAKEKTGMVRNYKTGGTTGSSTPVVKTYTKTYASNNSETYKGTGAKRTDTSDVVQGYNSYNGNGKGLWTFPSMTADLSGATVNKVEVYAYANHWYYNAGGAARIHVHGYSTAPASSPSMTYATQSSSWPKPGGRWVTLPSSFYAGFKSGTYRGFGVGPGPSTSLTYYGRFNGGTTARIRVTYTK